jgi:hypothetical protein
MAEQRREMATATPEWAPRGVLGDVQELGFHGLGGTRKTSAEPLTSFR